ncbi:hypothetical protein VCHA29O37_10115 [Vibrio chagasii]|nr:hypothetical protein VCHA29O37_10115 [Vibrio chagasii]CAH7242878.1 hypothetical protein VCHA37O177_10035 [Vibrio chagasii]
MRVTCFFKNLHTKSLGVEQQSIHIKNSSLKIHIRGSFCIVIVRAGILTQCMGIGELELSQNGNNCITKIEENRGSPLWVSEWVITFSYDI